MHDPAVDRQFLDPEAYEPDITDPVELRAHRKRRLALAYRVFGALGWIGAVWFAPIFGSLLYYLFGINRVTRRALKLGRLDSALAHAPDPATALASARFTGALSSSATLPQPRQMRNCAR